MFAGKNVVYEYDGTFDGFFSCVFESFQNKETPVDIRRFDQPQQTLDPARFIATNASHAARVQKAIPQKIGRGAGLLVRDAFLTFLPQKELHMLRFLQAGFAAGPGILRNLTDDTVCTLQKAQRHLYNESHRFKQFIRFSATEKVLSAVIRPRNQVLPLIAPHFIDRYPLESFLIYDETNGMALVYRPRQAAIIPVDNFVMDQPDETEQMYRQLWREYYDTIAIEERYNPKCRMTHMPKRYWDNMTEFCRPARPGLRGAAR